MSSEPWTALDPMPGDYDAEVAAIDPRYVERHAGHPGAGLRILVSVQGEDVERLRRLAHVRGKTAADVVAELLRDAEASAA